MYNVHKMQPTLTKPERSPQSFGSCGLGDVGVLVGLGLSVRQAKVYLALLRAGVAKVQLVSDLSGVHRQEVYRVLDGLQHMGLVQRKVSNPATFSVTPLSEAVKLLLGQRASELDLVARRAELLAKRLGKGVGLSGLEFSLRPCFGTIVEADRGRHFRVALKGVHEVFEAATSWRRFKQLSIHFEAQLLSAMRRGASVHVVTEKPIWANASKMDLCCPNQVSMF